jgi:hypothetical protein
MTGERGLHAAVGGVEQGGHRVQLFEGPVNAEGETQLPQSWLVDDQDAVRSR